MTRGFLLIGEGWEKTGKTSILKAIAHNGIGTYEKRKNQQTLDKTSIEMLNEDLTPGKYYDELQARLNSGENILLDRMWPSAYAYGRLRNEDKKELRRLCEALETRFEPYTTHLVTAKDREFLQKDDKFSMEQYEEVSMNYFEFYSGIASAPVLYLNTSDWHQFHDEADRNRWVVEVLGTVLKMMRVLDFERSGEGAYGISIGA